MENNSITDELNKNNHVSFEESTKTAETSAANNSTLLKKKKTNQKQVKLKSVENIDTLSTTNKSNDVNLKLSSKSTSLASVNSTRSSSSIFSYSYVILIASFFSYMLASLLSSCFGVFFESMSTDLNWSRSQVAFIGSLLTSLQDLAGPISSALTNHYGCRKTAMFGGLICALGIIGSAYTTNFWLFGFLMGGVSGFGGSLVLVSSVVVVTYYFEDKPSFAAGFTISGASMGQSIFTMIIIKLNEVYGRSGCFLILGGILLNIVVCGALFRPHPWELEDDDDEDDEEDDDEDDEDEDDDEEDEDEEEEDNDYENMDEVENELTETETKQIRKIATIESNLNENEEKKKENNAPMATNDDYNDDEQAEIELYFHDLFLMNEKNENQVFYSDQMNVGATGSNGGGGGAGNVTTSSQYLSNRKDFQSDPCLNSNNNENEMPSLGVSVISIASIQQQQQQEQERQHQLKNKQNFHKNQMFSYFDRHHSLQQIPTDHFNLNSNTSNSNLKQLAKSDLILKNFTSAYSLMMSKQQIIDDQQEEEEELRLDNAEFVLLDTEEMMTDCNSNLMLSSSQTAIYLPFLNDQPNLNEEQLNKIDLKREKSKSNILYNNSETCNETIEILANDTKKLMSQRNSYSEMKQSIEDETNETDQIKSKISSSTKISTFLNRFTNFFSKKTNKQELALKVTETPVPLVVPSSPPVQQQQQQVTVEANNQLITKTNKSKHIVTLDPVNYKLIINNRNQSDKTGPRFIIARCNCRQRNLQNLQKRTEKQQRRNKLRSNSVNIASNTNNNNNNNGIIDLPETNEKTSQSQSIINQTSVNMDINKKQMNRNSTPTNFDKNQFKFKHFPNCPISKLNRLKNMHIVQNQNSNHHHHHHHHYNHHLQASMLVNQAKRNNLYYVPSLFQNSYRFPLHFKNVYYYKSLINLNMRLKNLKSHGNHTATLAGVLNLKDFETNQPHIHLNNHHHHHNHHYSHHHQQQQQQTNNVSFSCPNLNPNQFFIVNKNVISFKRLNEQYGGQIVPIKGIRRPMQMLTKNDNNNTISTTTTTTTTNNSNTPINNSNTNNTKLNVQNLVQTKNLEFTSNLKDVSKVLNAGSIVISSSREMPTKKRLLNLNQTSGGKKLSTSSKQQSSDQIRKSNESLICANEDYNDNIQDSLLRKSKDKKSSIIEKQDEEDEEDEDDEEDEEDEDDDEDEEDDEEETCDNCFTRTKIGYYMYKNIWKPMINSFKFIFYSICENLKLFRFFKFSVFAFCNFILSFFYESPFIFINSYMVNNNLSEEQAGSVTIAVGIVCIFSSSNLIFSKIANRFIHPSIFLSN